MDDKERKKVAEVLEVKKIGQHDYTRTRHFFIAKLRGAFDSLVFFVDNFKSREFHPAKFAVVAALTLPLTVSTAFTLLRPFSPVRNLTTFGCFFACCFALGYTTKYGLTEFATQDNKQGRRV